MGGMKVLSRIGAVAVLTAGFLVPSLSAPARTILLPETLSRSVSLTRASALTRFSFEPTHVAFSWRGDEGTGVRYRSISPAGDWSRWRKAPEAHDAERADRHYSAVIAVNRPPAIEYEVIRPQAGTISDVTLDYLNTADGPRRAFTVPVLARAAASEPAIVTRAEWGADESLKSTTGGCARKFYEVQQLFVHHTAGKNFDPDPAGTMRAIYWYHTERQGWCDVGYNFVISPDGTIFEGRWARKYAPWEAHSSEDLSERAVAGAHVAGYNSGSVGVSVMGNFSQVKPPLAVRRSLAELLAWEADRHDLDPLGSHTYRNPESGATRDLKVISGHRAAGLTECPGNYLFRQLPGVRQDTAEVMGEGKTGATLSLTASPTQVATGESVTLSGRLIDDAGAPVISAPVTIYGRTGGRRWVVAGQTTSGLDGTYSFTTNPAVTTTYRAVYEGDASRWGAQSLNVRVRVIP